MAERPLFDPSRIRVPETERVAAGAATPLTPRQVNDLIRGSIERHVPSTLHVVGEIGDLSRPSSGHLYFSLKGDASELRCVMWRSAAQTIKFEPTTGLDVIATGGIDVYVPRGSYQLVVRRLEPRGVGALELAFRQLKERLEKEGLFDPRRKRPLPVFPRRIALVTSPSGAALRDIVRAVERRFPAVELLLFPVRVQGEEAAAEIAAAIRRMSAYRDEARGVDVAIVARGGGSLEDLWAFNEELVARAIFECGVPIISGIGHETDVSISDLVADVRAATPTAAAEVATPVMNELQQRLWRAAERAARCIRIDVERCTRRLAQVAVRDSFARPARRLHESAQRLDERMHNLARRMAERFRSVHAALSRAELAILRFGSGAALARIARGIESRVFAIRSALDRVEFRAAARLARALGGIQANTPLRTVERQREHLRSVVERLKRACSAHIGQAGERLRSRIERIAASSPASVLARGYSLTRDARSGELIRSLAQVRDRERIEIEVADGKFKATAEDPRQASLFE
jgi:exodeoxyribonuclease VII large subunit